MQTREVVVDRIEGPNAVLVLDDGQEINWPMDGLSVDISEGDVLKLSLLTDEELTRDREGSAKAILNEIFDTDM